MQAHEDPPISYEIPEHIGVVGRLMREQPKHVLAEADCFETQQIGYLTEMSSVASCQQDKNIVLQKEENLLI